MVADEKSCPAILQAFFLANLLRVKPLCARCQQSAWQPWSLHRSTWVRESETAFLASGASSMPSNLQTFFTQRIGVVGSLRHRRKRGLALTARNHTTRVSPTKEHRKHSSFHLCTIAPKLFSDPPPPRHARTPRYENEYNCPVDCPQDNPALNLDVASYVVSLQIPCISERGVLW